MTLGFLFESKPTFLPEGSPPDIYMEFENLESIQDIANHLEEMGHTVVLIDATKNLSSELNKVKDNVDLIFNYSVGFGSRSREIFPAAICEILNIPYTGSDPMAQAIGSHKHVTKLVAKYEGITTPNWYFIKNDVDLQIIKKSIKGLYIVKPAYEGSSIGIAHDSIVNTYSGVINSARAVLVNYKQPAIVERFIKGYEVTVPVLGTETPSALSPVGLQVNNKLVYGESIFSSKLKAETESVSWTAELPFEPSLIQRLKRWSERIHFSIGCRDLSRADFRVTSGKKAYFLEINTTPQLTPVGGTFVKSGAKSNLSFKDILARIISSAERRYSLSTPRTKPH